MYCINCGVKLADTEKKCPLCNTVVYHPDIKQSPSRPLYPENKMPLNASNPKILNGVIIILFFIPMLVCFLSDIQFNKQLDWFGFVAGALLVAYVAFALPLWFKKPNPVIFVPCAFIAAALYVLYINLETGGKWFLSFAFPVIGGVCLIICTVITLFKYLQKGKLYILGGAFIALGAFMLLVEFLMVITFKIGFIGWSVYPLVVLVLIGAALIYLAINASAREMMERKLFF
ncbi:MAG: hypothetical protein IJE02_05535 [Clostridia bacterium]|nr:hypothetical protein [Clostridia bacterium]